MSISHILTQYGPVQFFNNLGSAVGKGVGGFRDNIAEHMKGGFMQWMTGKMNSLPIQMPEKFDLKGILSIITQILGVGWGVIRSKLAMKVGEENISRLEKGIEEGTEVVARVKEEGPIGAWHLVEEHAETIKTEVVEGAKEWAIIEIVKQAVLKLVSMLNPAGAIVQAIMAIFNTVMFFMNNWQQVTAFVSSIFDSISSIAKGAIGAAAGFVEKSMAMAIPLMLDFLAQMLNLGGIADRIQKIIERVRKPIDQILDKIINWIMKKANKLLGRDKGKKKGKHDDDDDDKDEKGDGKLTKADRKLHEQYAEEIEEKLINHDVSDDLEKAYKEKYDYSQKLEKIYNKKLKKGIKTTITFESLGEVEKDQKILVTIEIAPNNTKKKTNVPVKGKSGELKVSEKFKGADGKTHELAVEKDDKSEVFDLRPEFVSVYDYVASLGKEADEAKRNKALGHINKIKTIIKHEVSNSERKEIVKNLTGLAKVLMELVGMSMVDVPGREEVVKEYGGFGAPRYARIEKLSYKTASGGSGPDGTTKGWDLIQNWGLSKTWVQMHLFIEKLGGPGSAENLVPGPKSVNSGGMMNSYESSLREIFKKVGSGADKKTQVPSVIWIMAKVEDWYPAAKDQSYDETTFASMISFKAGYYYPNEKKQWIKDSAPKLMQRAIPVPKPDSKGDPEKPNVNYITQKALRELIGTKDANTLQAERDLNGLFNGKGDLSKRLTNKISEDSLTILKSTEVDAKIHK